MNDFIIDEMERLLDLSNQALRRGEQSYSVKTDQLDYFPKHWESVFTYINENVLRLDNLYNPEDGNIDFDKVEDKWVDLFNYVRMGYAVMQHMKMLREVRGDVE